MIKEYRTIQEVAGPLMLVTDVEGVTYNELGEIELPSGEIRRCKVLEVNGNTALVQLFESAQGINLEYSKIRFLGKSQELPVSEDMLGRIFSGMGTPIDGGPAIMPDKRMDINGLPIEHGRPAGTTPARLSRTGVSAIDGLNTLGRGQKLPFFLGSGLPHAKLAARNRPTGQSARHRQQVCGGVRRHRHHLRGVGLLYRGFSGAPGQLTARCCLSTWPTTRPSSASRPRVWR